MIRKARREDFEFFYTIKCEEDNLYWCGYREKPVRDDLHAFWKRYVSTDKESAVEDTDNMRGAFCITKDVRSTLYRRKIARWGICILIIRRMRKPS